MIYLSPVQKEYVKAKWLGLEAVLGGTNQVKTGDIQAAAAEIQNHDFIQEKIKIIHVETLD